MKAYASPGALLSSSVPEVTIEHNGVKIKFAVSVYGRATFQDSDYDVFHQINQFWSTIHPDEQDRVFELYSIIYDRFGRIAENEDFKEVLVDCINKLYEIHNLDRLQDWITFSSDISIPDSFTVDYTHSVDNNTSREKTYTKSDYVKLVTLSLALRVMIPIWGEFISNIRHNTGTQFKEFYAFQLLTNTTIMHSVPMEKLKIYIEHIIGQDKYDPNKNMNNISSEDYGFWLLSLVCIRRLCTGDIRGNDVKAHLITLIYKFIIQKIRNNDSNFENQVRFKTFDDKGGSGKDSENKISVLERYKIKTNISLGEIVQLEYSMRDIPSIANKLTSKLDFAMLERSLNTSHKLMDVPLLDPQMCLLRWVFKPVISPRGLMYLPKFSIVQALGVLETVLWARGFKYLAILSTCQAVFSNDREIVISPVDSKMRVPKELTEKLDDIYPYKRINNNRKTVSKNTNLAAASIDTLADNLSLFSWRPTCDDSMLEEVFGTITRKFPIKPDIKIDLTKLVIQIGERSWI
jgi:hypothetical protein